MSRKDVLLRRTNIKKKKLTSSESENGHPLTETRTSGSLIRNPLKIHSASTLFPKEFFSSAKSSSPPSGNLIPKSGIRVVEEDLSVGDTHRKLARLADTLFKRPLIKTQIIFISEKAFYWGLFWTSLE